MAAVNVRVPCGGLRPFGVRARWRAAFPMARSAKRRELRFGSQGLRVPRGGARGEVFAAENAARRDKAKASALRADRQSAGRGRRTPKSDIWVIFPPFSMQLPVFVLLLLSATLRPAGADLVKDIPELRSARQLVVVKSRSWRDLHAVLQVFERSVSGTWRPASDLTAAVLGWHGLGWGLGLHGSNRDGGPEKIEGDGRSPAGVFRFAEAFGTAEPRTVRFLKIPYRKVTSTTEAIDDEHSRFYNRIVDTSEIEHPDWQQSEKMARVGGRYHWGLLVEHNWRQIPGRGSCIFFHVWAGPRWGTIGCTALAENDLEKLLRWLDPQAKPLLVQLPEFEYAKMRDVWGLP
jgi:L,D-peptidoglycan transpeptidase YkuD (ErfK/YbiS/YcfS/YnhG family)